MIQQYSKAIKYSMIENICTIFIIDKHTLSDVLKCKRDVRKLHPDVKFRKIININKEAICQKTT